jgi:hypothetical protein
MICNNVYKLIHIAQYLEFSKLFAIRNSTIHLAMYFLNMGSNRLNALYMIPLNVFNPYMC